MDLTEEVLNRLALRIGREIVQKEIELAQVRSEAKELRAMIEELQTPEEGVEE